MEWMNKRYTLGSNVCVQFIDELMDSGLKCEYLLQTLIDLLKKFCVEILF